MSCLRLLDVGYNFEVVMVEIGKNIFVSDLSFITYVSWHIWLILAILLIIALILGFVGLYIRLRKVESLLQGQETQSQTIIGALPLGIEVYSREGVLLSLNDRDCEIFGVKREQVLNSGITIEGNPNVPDKLKKAFTCKEKGHADFMYDFNVVRDTEYYGTVLENEAKWISCTGTPVLDKEGEMVNYVFIVDDITNQYHQEQQLEESLRLSDLAIQVSDMVLWKYNKREDLFSAYNSPLNNYDRNVKFSVKDYLSVIHPDDKIILQNCVEHMNKGVDKSYECDLRLKMSDDNQWQYCTVIGAPFSKDSAGNVLEYTGFRRNNTRWKNLNDQLRAVNIQNELILNNTNSGLVYITIDYVVQWENLSICSASLSSEAYKKGEVCYKSTYGRTRPCENCVMQQALRSGLSEQRIFKLSGRTIEAIATPVLGKDNKPDGVVVRLDDVSERQQMITDLHLAKEEAIRSDKLKSTFLANMSHEIRTPLNAIVGFADLLMSADDEKEKEEYNRIIMANNELLLRLINDILNLSKMEAGFIDRRPELFDLSPYFDELCFSVQQRMVNPAVEFIRENPYPHCMVYMDKNRFAQVIMNYATNAIKYTSKGFIRMGYVYKDGGIKLYVSDSGIGIAEEKKERVYQRFEKLDEFAQGTGLGLSICKVLTESSGGEVGFESKEGAGSTFWSWVPTKVVFGEQENDKGTISIKGYKNIDECGNGEKLKKILIVEDIESNFKLLFAMLHKHFELIWAVNGVEAVEKAKTEFFNLILMDMKMPLMNGLEATSKIREFDQVTPVVALTAHAFDSDKEAALVAGCNDYLVKPVNKRLLFEALDRWMI